MRRRAQAKSNFIGVLLIVGSIAVAAAIGIYTYVTRSPKIDPALCAPDGPNAVVAIAIDATDQLTEAQRLSIKNALIASVDALPSGTRIELWTVAPSSGVPERTGDIFCRPMESSKVSELTGNMRLVKDAEESFRVKFSGALDSALTRPSSNSSPIIETLQAIDVRSFSTLAIRRAPVKKVILVSDLIQNTSAMSLLTDLPFAELPKGMTVSLPAVDVEVQFIDRTPASYGTGALIQWWRDLLPKVGARLTKVERR